MATIEDISDMLERNTVWDVRTGCWVWQRGVSGGKYKYPVWGYKTDRKQVSHLALLVRGIEVPKGFDACHSCDNPLCVNPDHLFCRNARRQHARRESQGQACRLWQTGILQIRTSAVWR